MAYEKTWSFALNTAPTDQTTLANQCKSFLLQLKQFLVGTLGWTVAYSSNATTANTSDNWSAVSDIVQASAGSNHSHITLKSPVGMCAGLDGSYTGDQSRYWLTLDYSGTNAYSMGSIRIHNVAPTGGSLTAVQTSTNQSGTTSWTFNATTLTAGYFHFAGLATGHFWAGFSRTGSGNMGTFLALLPGLSPAVNGATGLDFPFNAALFTPAYTSSGALAWSVSTLYTPNGFNADQTASTSVQAMTIAVPTNGNVIGVAGGASGDTWAGKVSLAPLYLHNATASKAAYLGRVPDIFATGSLVAQGGVDNSGSIAWQLIGVLYLPVNAAINW